MTDQAFAGGSLEDRVVPASDRTPVDIVLRGEPYVAAVSNTLLSNGQYYTQDEHVARFHNDFTLIPSDVYFAVIKSLLEGTHGTDEKSAKTLIDKIRSDFVRFWMLTGTRAIYASQEGQDSLVHSFGTPSPRTISNLSLAGPNIWLAEMTDRDVFSDAYFGAKADDAEAAFRDLTGKQSYHQRKKSRPSEGTEERAVLLGLGESTFDIDADDDLFGDDDWLARGVAIAPRKIG